MFTSRYRKLYEEVSPRRAMNHLAGVTRFHRIQVSPGFSAAAQYVADTLTSFGLQTEILTYPADGSKGYWGQPPLPLEWSIEEGVLSVVEPDKHREKLTDYVEEPLSIIQRSGSTPAGGITAEVVIVDKADREPSYEEIDVTGKFVLADCDPGQSQRLAVKERGAVGVITDHMPVFEPVRPEMDLPDARAYRSFWWGPDDEPCPGFVLTPRQGKRLRRAISEGEEPVKVHALVNSSFSVGEMQVVSARVPGEGDEEILITAHLCHPEPSANDNASGVAAGMEAARALKALIDNGDLPVPNRSIRFLFVPEMAGTYAYLATNEDHLSKYVAGLNLDMVGQDQDLCGSTLIAEQPPRSLANYSGDLVALLIQHAGQQHRNFAGTARYASFRYTETPFSGGSDHYIMSDPTVGIPTPMVIQWPDRFYHTSEDTIDKVDPEMLARVACITATYAHFTAAPRTAEVVKLGAEMAGRFAETLRVSRGRTTDYARRGRPDRAEAYLDFLGARREADLDSLGRLADIPEAVDLYRRQVRDQLAWEKRILQHLVSSGAVDIDEEAEQEHDPEREEKLRSMIPKRLHRGPVSLRRLLQTASPERQKQWHSLRERAMKNMAAYTLALYWADGKLSLAEIRDVVEFESTRDITDTIIELYETLEELDQVQIRRT